MQVTMAGRLRLLIIEDSEDDAVLLVRNLERSGFSLTHKIVDTRQALLMALKKGTWDAVISDYMLPGFDAMVALKLVKSTGQDLPFIIVSGKIGEETAVAAMKAGAHDYIMKNNLVRLGPALERELQDARVRREKRIAENNALELQTFREIDRLHRQFLSNISHELRTPLATIKGFVTTLLSGDVIWREHEKRDFLVTINNETDRLAHMIDELMDMSSIESGKLKLNRKACSVQEILDSVINELRALAAAHELEIDVSGGIPPVLADGIRVGQVLVNLVDNAVKNSAPGTTVKIAATREDNSAVISVSDRGKGIPDDLQQKIFDRFFQDTSIGGELKGAGLGLPICKGIVEAHGGRIWVESRPGVGSKFSFTLPHSKL
jgi:signal transduction histidine kinase